MELLTKLEKQILKWAKDLPHLPESVRKWLGDNVWWIAAIGLVLTAIGALFVLFGTLLTSAATVYVLPAVAALALVTGLVALAFLVLEVVVLALSIKPLQLKQKKGWVLLYVLWLLGIAYVVVNAVLTLNPFAFILQIILSAIWVAISGYFLFEIHGQFAHVEKSRGVKQAAKKKV